MPAQALTMKECSAKYEAAKKAGTLNGMKWNDFRKAQCGSEANASPAAAPSPPPAARTPAAAPSPPPAARTPAAAPRQRSTARTTTSPAAPGNVVFPNAVSPKYSSQSPGRARLLTCRDQYQANKANNANGGLRWIEKGGGYWSECNRHLKG
jgi:hypothetical protein